MVLKLIDGYSICLNPWASLIKITLLALTALFISFLEDKLLQNSGSNSNRLLLLNCHETFLGLWLEWLRGALKAEKWMWPGNDLAVCQGKK